jgi:hypothetical protein
MRKMTFSIAMSLLLIGALVPMFAGPAVAQELEGEVELATTVMAYVCVDVSPANINFGELLPGECSSDPGKVPAVDREINLDNCGNVDVLLETTIIGEERTVEGETLGTGNGSQTLFGPTDYTPIIAASETVYLGPDVQDPADYTMDYVAGTVDFDTAPAGGVLVSIDYESASTFYTDNMTLDDPAAPPPVAAVDYSRVLVDDDTALPVSDICVPLDYPVGAESATIVFWATALVGDDPPEVTFQNPLDGADIDVGTVVTIETRNVDDWGVVAEEFEVINVGTGLPVASGPLTLVSGTVLDGIWQATWDTTGAVCDLAGEAYTITVTATDTSAQTGADTVGIDLYCLDAPPTAVIDAPAPMATVSGTVTIDATINDDVGILFDGGLGTYVVGYEIDDDGIAPPLAQMLLFPVSIDGQGRGTYTGTWDSTTLSDGTYILGVGATDTSFQRGGTGQPIVVDNWTTYHIVVSSGSSATDACIGAMFNPLGGPEAGDTSYDMEVSNYTVDAGGGTVYRETLVPQASFVAPPTCLFTSGMMTQTEMSLGADVAGRLYVSGGDLGVYSETNDSGTVYTFGGGGGGAGHYQSVDAWAHTTTTHVVGFGDPSAPCPIEDPGSYPGGFIISQLTMEYYDTTMNTENVILAGSTMNCTGMDPLPSSTGVLTGAAFVLDGSDMPVVGANGTWVGTYAGLALGDGTIDLQSQRTWNLTLSIP